MHYGQCLAQGTAYPKCHMTGICCRIFPEPPSFVGILPEGDRRIRALAGPFLPVFGKMLG